MSTDFWPQRLSPAATLALFFSAMATMMTACGPGSSLQTCAAQYPVNGNHTIQSVVHAQGHTELAQPFQVTQAATISSVELYLLAVSSDPTQQTFLNGITLTVKLEEDQNSSLGQTPSPTASPTAPNSNPDSSTFINAATVQTVTPNFYTFPFPAKVNLLSGKVYWLSLDASYDPSSKVLVNWLGYDTHPYTFGTSLERNTVSTNWLANDTPNTSLVFRLGCP